MFKEHEQIVLTADISGDEEEELNLFEAPGNSLTPPTEQKTAK